MNKFDERKKSFEAKFVKDEELQFKIKSKRNKYLADWVSEKIKKNEEEKSNYFQEIIKTYMYGKSDIVYGKSRVRPSKEEQDKAGDEAVFKKIKVDLKDHSVSDEDIKKQMAEFNERAKSDFA